MFEVGPVDGGHELRGHSVTEAGASRPVSCRFRNLSAACGLVVGWGVFAAAPVLAQSASQITPRSFAPPIQRSIGGGIVVGTAPSAELVAAAREATCGIGRCCHSAPRTGRPTAAAGGSTGLTQHIV